jgi:hypothetical protein
MINYDDIHFVAFKKKQHLRIKGHKGSFICNSRAAGEESNNLLKEMAESEGHKEEMLKLIMEQNAQIKEMEAELDKLVKEKEQSVPMIVIPLEVVPLTGVSTTSTATTTEIPSTIPVTVPDASEKLAKSMEDMTLQGEEIKILQE